MSGKQLYGPADMLAGRASADYSVTGRYRFVGFAGTSSSVDGVPNVTLASVQGQECLGVLTDKPKSGETASVQVGGLAKCEAGAALATVGTKVMCDSSGRVIAATSTNRVLGETMDISGASGDIITVRLYPVHPVA